MYKIRMRNHNNYLKLLKISWQLRVYATITRRNIKKGNYKLQFFVLFVVFNFFISHNKT